MTHTHLIRGHFDPDYYMDDLEQELTKAYAWMREAASYLVSPDAWTRAGAADLADRCPLPPEETKQ